MEQIVNKNYIDNTNRISNKMRQAQILNAPSTGGKIRYGNFGTVLNATTVGNETTQSLINTLESNPQPNITSINNTIGTYAEFSCLNPQINQQVNYNQFYTNYANLQNYLSQQNLTCSPLFHNNFH